jgi:hypothetical protein
MFRDFTTNTLSPSDSDQATGEEQKENSNDESEKKVSGKLSKSHTFDMPAVGFGFGDAVIIELLKIKGLIPDFSKFQQCRVVVYAMDMLPDLHASAIKTVTSLREHGVSAEIIMQPKKAKWVFQRADRLNSGNLVKDIMEADLICTFFYYRNYFVICS